MPKEPSSSAPRLELAYALHTATCTYLLDDEGVCRWIVSPRGAAPAHVHRAVGAQFVACLDLEEPGGLIGELRPGCMALFVRSDDGHMVLLRTARIERVDDRRAPTTSEAEAEPEVARPAARQRRPSATAAREPARQPLLQQYGKSDGLPYMAKPPPRLTAVKYVGAEQTVTLTVATKKPSTRGARRSDPET